MGIGDNVRGAAENALKDLAGLSEPNDDAHAPEPGDPNDEIKVHSSISEGANAGEAESEAAVSGTDRTSGPGQGPGEGHGDGTAGHITRGDDGPGASGGRAAADEDEESFTTPPHGVPGPGGLPEPAPDGLRADPSEGDGDPTTSMGRG